MNRLTFILALLCSVAHGQTTYTLDAASQTQYPSAATGIDLYPANTFSAFWYDNLLAAVASLQGTERDMVLLITAATTTTSFTADTTSGSRILNSVSSLSGLGFGQQITGAGIPALTYIVAPTTPTFTGTTSTSTGLVTAVSSLTGLYLNQAVTGSCLAANTTITAIGATNTITVSQTPITPGACTITGLFTISANASATASATAITGATSFTDFNSFSGVPQVNGTAGVGYLGWTFKVRAHYAGYKNATITGGAYGCTGTVTFNTAASQVFLQPGNVISATASTCPSPIVAGDNVELVAPVLDYSGGFGWGITSGSFAVDTTPANLPPGYTVNATYGTLPQISQVTRVAVAGSNQINNTTIDGTNSVIMNGTATLSLMANLISGSCTIAGSQTRPVTGDTFISGAPQTITTGWHTYTFTGTGAETVSGSNQSILSSTGSVVTGGIATFFNFSGTCQVDIIAVKSTGAAQTRLTGTTLTGGAYQHTNGTVFSDNTFNQIAMLNADELRYNYAYGGPNVDACGSLLSLLQPIEYANDCTTAQSASPSPGTKRLGLHDQLAVALAEGHHRFKVAVNPMTTVTDYLNLADYLGGACGTSTYATYRCALGQVAPWNSVFTSIDIGWNETWNNASTGQLLGQCCSYETATGLALQNVTALLAHSTWNPAIDHISVPMQAGGGVPALLAGYDPTHRIQADQSDYMGSSTSDCTQPNLFKNDLAGVWDNLVNASGVNTNYALGQGGQPVRNYETAFGSLNGNCTTISEPGVDDGLGSGIIQPLTVAFLQRKWSGVFLNYDRWQLTDGPNQPYTSNASSSPATRIHIWSTFQNGRGMGAYGTPYVYAVNLHNTAAKLGTGFVPTQTGVPLINIAAGNGEPAVNNVELVSLFAYTNGANGRAYLAANNDSVQHTITLAGVDVPTGTWTQTLYHSHAGTPALNDHNEILNTTPVVYNDVSTVTAPTSVVLPPYSMTLLQGSVGGGPPATIYQVIPGP